MCMPKQEVCIPEFNYSLLLLEPWRRRWPPAACAAAACRQINGAGGGIMDCCRMVGRARQNGHKRNHHRRRRRPNGGRDRRPEAAADDGHGLHLVLQWPDVVDGLVQRRGLAGLAAWNHLLQGLQLLVYLAPSSLQSQDAKTQNEASGHMQEKNISNGVMNMQK